MYWFLRVFRVKNFFNNSSSNNIDNSNNSNNSNDSNEFKKNGKEYDVIYDENFKDRQVIYQDTIKCDSKEDAKKVMFEKFGKIPLRKTNKLKDGDLYGYIAESDEYWYDHYHKKYTYKCVNCGKEITVEGKFQYGMLSNKYGHYCSSECKEKYYDVMHKIELENNPWIVKDDHLGIPKDYDSKLVGYIYRITNKRERKSYIGKTINAPLFRWWQHLKSDSEKFDRWNITDLLFEVLEIVTYDKNLPCDEFYKDGEDKLARREMFWITHEDTANPEKGYNKMIETQKIGNVYQLELQLEE